MIEVHDNKVPFHIQQNVYQFILNSNFRIKGWFDRDDIEGDKQDLHSQWSLDDLKNSKLYNYIEEIQSFDTFEKQFSNEALLYAFVNLPFLPSTFAAHSIQFTKAITLKNSSNPKESR